MSKSGHVYSQVSIMVYIYVQSGDYSQSQYIMNSSVYYVSEHQLPHLIDASHTTPTTRINQGPKLLKLVGWRHCQCFRWVPYIPGTTAQSHGAEVGPTTR